MQERFQRALEPHASRLGSSSRRLENAPTDPKETDPTDQPATSKKNERVTAKKEAFPPFFGAGSAEAPRPPDASRYSYAEGGKHTVSNGLLLRSDIHRLFDQGYVTVTADHRFEVSDRLKDDYDNGRTYYPLHGQPVSTPGTLIEKPDPMLIEWHNENRFLG